MSKLQIVSNQIQTNQTRRLTHTDGREYLIAPDVAIVEGVMNGLLYTADEMTRFIDVWNGKPLTINHPQSEDGGHISANSPEQFAQSIGFFFNADFDSGRLKGEWWIDIERAKAIGGDAAEVVRRLEANELVEQSTGLFADVEAVEGEWQGTPYHGIARNIRPDHLAILLHDVGACSIEDGCGAPRINQESQDNGSIKLIADKVLNFFKSEFLADRERQRMNEKQDLIASLVANKHCPFSAEYLENAEMDELNKLQSLLAANEEAVEEIEVDETEDSETAEAEDGSDEVASLRQEVADLREMVAPMLSNQQAERDALISEIVANTEFEADELGNMSDNQLQKIAATIKPEVVANYSLRPAPRVIEGDEWEDYETPVLNGKEGK